MSEDIRIHSWPCSYYQESSKQWIPGNLSLTPLSIQFRAGETGELLLHSRLSGISQIKKECSHFIFSSITVLERSTKHWFSSLHPNRNVVFNILEHFWREQLLPGQGSGKGRELTGMLEGSQKRLEDTAKVLHSQGEQFDRIMTGLHKIEGDMDVADRLLTELESPSWWPFSTKLWKTPPESKPRETPPTPDPKSREGILLRIPVIVTHGTDSNAKPGKLAVLSSGLEIRDGNSQLLQRFGSRDVDDIRVHTPYEISVRQRFLGKADNSFRLLAARMPEVIPILEVQFSQKIQFLEDALGFAGARRCPQVDSGTSVGQAGGAFPGAVVNPRIPTGSGEGMDKEQEQRQKVSQEEAKELRKILQKLKGLALETEAELERQDEALESIGSSVDRATLTIERQNRRMRRLT
ncbi:synaptosomal-associated protein 47 isoform X2 [Cinclus cinclus]|uniref:synaptosomal-associated protein 47 isoform X2 n=1 Tax=Cinclus cinclus TaxID=127875 RepID=UPI002E108E5F